MSRSGVTRPGGKRPNVPPSPTWRHTRRRIVARSPSWSPTDTPPLASSSIACAPAPEADIPLETDKAALFLPTQVLDPAFTTALYDVLMNQSIATDQRFKAIEHFPVQWGLRIGIRSVRDERYKFSRYFSFKQFNMPRTMEELTAKNDLELYDLQNDPQEVNNLALDVVKNKELILTMNQKLNALIESEIGVDDGSFLKFSNWINWTGKEVVNS
mgnify:CR=1 FL=1